MQDHFRFVPPSLEAFKRTARDIQRAYPLGLQQCQDLLSKAYGYPDRHALFDHLKTSPEPGPFANDLNIARMAGMRMAAVRRFDAFSGGARPLGRLSVDDLAIVERPDVRRSVMDQHAVVDSILAGTFVSSAAASVSDYLWFEEQDIPVDPLLSTRTVHEGVFRLTPLSRAFIDAINWRVSTFDEDDTEAQGSFVEWLGNLAEDHPANPYVFARFIDYVGSEFYNSEANFPTTMASTLWPKAVRCREAFDSVVPADFRGQISHNLVGNNAHNREYFSLLYFGALCAKQLSLRKDALAWARRSVKFCKYDSLGAFVLLAHLQGKPDPRLKIVGANSAVHIGLPKFHTP